MSKRAANRALITAIFAVVSGPKEDIEQAIQAISRALDNDADPNRKIRTANNKMRISDYVNGATKGKIRKDVLDLLRNKGGRTKGDYSQQKKAYPHITMTAAKRIKEMRIRQHKKAKEAWQNAG